MWEAREQFSGRGEPGESCSAEHRRRTVTAVHRRPLPREQAVPPARLSQRYSSQVFFSLLIWSLIKGYMFNSHRLSSSLWFRAVFPLPHETTPRRGSGSSAGAVTLAA